LLTGKRERIMASRRVKNFREIFFIVIVFVVIMSSNILADSPFATSVISSSGLAGDGIYNDPVAVLGKPSTWIYDPGYDDPVYGYPESTTACSMVNSAWNTDPSGNKLIVSMAEADEIVVGFDHSIQDDAANPYGLDFIVFGAYAFIGSDWVTEDTDMATYTITDGSLTSFDDFAVTVSVSPDLTNWYTYTTTVNNGNFMPTHAYEWDSVNGQWGDELEWTKPLDPTLAQTDFANKTVAEAIDMYNGSAGGMAFDLSVTGFSSINYIKVTGPGKIDGFADVAAVPEPATIMLFGLGGFLAFRRRARNLA
jgi:hypothetical protein